MMMSVVKIFFFFILLLNVRCMSILPVQLSVSSRLTRGECFFFGSILIDNICHLNFEDTSDSNQFAFFCNDIFDDLHFFLLKNDCSRIF